MFEIMWFKLELELCTLCTAITTWRKVVWEVEGIRKNVYDDFEVRKMLMIDDNIRRKKKLKI